MCRYVAVSLEAAPSGNPSPKTVAYPSPKTLAYPSPKTLANPISQDQDDKTTSRRQDQDGNQRRQDQFKTPRPRPRRQDQDIKPKTSRPPRHQDRRDTQDQAPSPRLAVVVRWYCFTVPPNSRVKVSGFPRESMNQ
jgi:hypothetical protein